MNRRAARCPSCQSVFFVSAAQGKVANNLVRCGRCGHLFSVLEHSSDSLSESEVGSGLRAAPESSESLDGSDVEPPLDEPALLAAPSGETAGGKVLVEAFDLSNLKPGLPSDFELAGMSTPRAGAKQCLGLAIIIVGLLMLAGQFVFFQLPVLSQNLDYRPGLQVFCTVLPCELDAYSEPSLVSVENLQVRAHPDLEGGLLLELVLSNVASLEQAYPPLLLRFDDLAGQQVAARRLLATEYLPQNISADSLMPVDKAVRITLSILDPGEHALSYSVTITP